MPFGTFAQLDRGCTAPDFTLTDINGNVHHLYDYLDQGKTVVVDFMTTWCPPCWTAHQEHYLKTLYEKHGPNGTLSQDVIVLMVESDAGTGVNCLYGTQQPTKGDYVTGTPYPIFNPANENVPNAYGVEGYATIFIICPEHTIVGVAGSGYSGEELYDFFVKDCLCKNALYVYYQAESANTMNVMFGDPSLFATDFEVQYQLTTTPSVWTSKAFTDPGGSITRLEPGKSYRFRARVFCQGAWSPWSSTQTWTTAALDDCTEYPITSGYPTGPDSYRVFLQYRKDAMAYRLRYYDYTTSDYHYLTSLRPVFDISGLESGILYATQISVFCNGSWTPYEQGPGLHHICTN